jgi:hypothetical protein
MKSSGNLPKINLNVMEELVNEEIDKQLKSYPSSLSQYIDRLEVATYALNRLPPLYASSQKGKNQQRSVARQLYQDQIQTATRQGIAAVRRDPIRASTPLVSQAEIEYREASEALQQLRELFRERLGISHPLTWQNLVDEVSRAFRRAGFLQANGPDQPENREDERTYQNYRKSRPKTPSF